MCSASLTCVPGRAGAVDRALHDLVLHLGPVVNEHEFVHGSQARKLELGRRGLIIWVRILVLLQRLVIVCAELRVCRVGPDEA